MRDYYDKKSPSDKDIYLTLIGESDELERIKLSEDYLAVKQYINAPGAKYGNDLDNEYDHADIAVSSLGMHRIGLSEGSTLKTREYCAKGIPFVYGYKEKGIDESFPFALRVPATDDMLDMKAILSFYEGIKDLNYIDEMRTFSKKYDWINQMKLFFDELLMIED